MKVKLILACAYTFGCLLIFCQNGKAQRIRKDHREMTPGEKSAYLQALNQMFANGIVTDMANHHAGHFESEIHTRANPINGTQFLPWHRIFQLEVEQKLRSMGTPKAGFLTIPYWDWRVENTVANVTWDDNNFLSSAFVSPWGVTRSLGGATLASATDVTTLLSLTGAILPTSWQQQSTTSTFFSKRLERWHDLGHVFVGGTMNSAASPADPIFFLHHGFVDKLWQDWEDRDNAVQSLFNYTSLIHYTLINPNTIIDSRLTRYQDDNGNIFETDVWYAYNKKLILDGLNGNYNVTGTGKLYCYTAWNGTALEGTIYAGDLRRDASDNVISDNKGGIIIKNGSQCDFRAGTEIILRPGFTVEPGAQFTASIVPTPCGFTSNTSARPGTAQPDKGIQVKSEVAMSDASVYPNPFITNLKIRFTLLHSSLVSIRVLNSLGQTVAFPLIGKQMNSGLHTLDWTPSKDISSGIYYCIIQTNSSKQVIKLSYSK